MTAEILTLAKALCGDTTDETLLEQFCRAAETALKGRLREGVQAEQCGPAFPLAAACIAAADACAAQTEQVEAFSAGDVTIRHSAQTPQAKSAGLLVQAERLMEPWICDRCFCFQGVLG